MGNCGGLLIDYQHRVEVKLPGRARGGLPVSTPRDTARIGKWREWGLSAKLFALFPSMLETQLGKLLPCHSASISGEDFVALRGGP